jgi:CRISPR/Cas system-associated exonuclease Cas4 (RecB family)
MTMKETADRIIRASEIGQYIFCARAWWLGAVEGVPSAHREEMDAGESAHRQHGRRVRAAVILSRLAWALLALALFLAVLALLGR